MKRFKYLVFLAAHSAWNRRGTLLLIVLCVALSVTLLLGIERLRTQVRESFVQAVSGTDLVVGARGGDIQLMLYAIFHVGGATNNMGWDSAREIAARPEVAWTIPVSLGDSHKGYPVVATTEDFFAHYRFQRDKHLTFVRGRAFDGLFDVVLGAETARSLGYDLGRPLVLSHGASATRLSEHADLPFTVTGILAPTGTPVDRSLYISLAAMEALHVNWRGGAPLPGMKLTPEQAARFNLEPRSITALLVGLSQRSRVFALQREIQGWKSEPLTGVMPGVVMDRIWRMMNVGERALLLMSVLVTITGLAGLVSAILAGLGERRRELAILRSAGAKPTDIFVLLTLEGLLVTLAGAVAGVLALTGLVLFFGPALANTYGIAVRLAAPGAGEWLLLGGVCAAGLLSSLIPAVRAYRMSLSDGLSVSV